MAKGGPGTKYGRLTSIRVRLTSIRSGRRARVALDNSSDAATGRHASRRLDPHCAVPAPAADTPPVMLATASNITALRIIVGLIVSTPALAIGCDGCESPHMDDYDPGGPEGYSATADDPPGGPIRNAT